MSLEQSDTTRRRLLKSIGVTGLALGAAGVASANGTDGDDAPASSDDEVSPDGTWQYQCTSYPCSSGNYCQYQRRYCSNGDCSGWEDYGCCDGVCYQ